MNNRIDAIYARQSVDKRDSISIESQIEFCKYELKGGNCKEYTDKGYSGKNTDRPKFQELKRVTDAYYSRSQRGFKMGGKAPYGFHTEPLKMDGINTMVLVLNPEEAANIRLMFVMYAQPTTSYGDITQYFAKQGILFNGKELIRPTLAQMLRNPVYVQADLDVYEFFKSQGTACRKKLMNNMKIQSARKATHTWLVGKIKCGNYVIALMSVTNPSKKEYLCCTKRIDSKSCPGCGKIMPNEGKQCPALLCECVDSGTGRAQTGTSGEDSGADGGSHQSGTGQPDFRLPRHLGECIL